MSSQRAERESLFPRSPASVARARTFVAEQLVQLRCTVRLEDARYCTSELAANAVRHGVPTGRGFVVRVVLDDDFLRIEVHDSGDGVPQLRQPDLMEANGRGLLLVAALADEWGVAHRSGPGKAVWVAFKREESCTATALPQASPEPILYLDIPKLEGLDRTYMEI